MDLPFVEDGDLVPCAHVQFVIGHPPPSVLEVAVGLRRDVQQQEGTHTIRQIGTARRNSPRALDACVHLEFRARRASNTPVGIPHSGVASGHGVDVPLYDYSTRTRPFDLEDDVRYLHRARVARIANLPHGYRIRLVAKERARGHDDGQTLAGDFQVFGHEHS